MSHTDAVNADIAAANSCPCSRQLIILTNKAFAIVEQTCRPVYFFSNKSSYTNLRK
jgi:hypothetical protein